MNIIPNIIQQYQNKKKCQNSEYYASQTSIDREIKVDYKIFR